MKKYKILQTIITILITSAVNGQGFTSAPGNSPLTTLAITVDNPAGYGIYIGHRAYANNTAVGYNALLTLPGNSGTANTALGGSTLEKITYGVANTAVGCETLRYPLGSGNTCVGNASGRGTLTSSIAEGNTAVGASSLTSIQTATFNCAFGSGALSSLQAGSQNIGIGNSAISSLIGNFNGNIGMGSYSLRQLTSGGNNIGIGGSGGVPYGTDGALSNLTSGYNNIAIGGVSGANATTMSNLTTGSNNIGIGAGTQVSSATTSDELTIQNVIFGIHMDGVPNYGNGNIGIGIRPAGTGPGILPTNSFSKLHIAGNQANNMASLQLDYVPTHINPGTNYLYVDPATGVVGQTTLPGASGINTCYTVGQVPVTSNVAGDMTCSEIYDNGTSVGIGTVFNSGSSFAYTVVPGSQWLNGSGTGSTTTPLSGNLKLAVDGVTQSLAYYAYSDKRYKTNIQPIKNSIGIIKKLNGVTYMWDKNSKGNKTFNDIPQVGFIAQEVEKVVPEAVIVDKEGFYSMNYSTIIPILNEGIKEQQSQIDKLEITVADQQSVINELKNKINQLVPGNVITKDDNFQITPNPVTGISTVNYKLNSSISNAEFIVYDLQGKMLKKYIVDKNLKQGQVQITKTDFGNGMYILSLVSNSQEIQSKRFLIVD